MERISLEKFKMRMRYDHYTAGVNTTRTEEEQKTFIESVPVERIEKIRLNNAIRGLSQENKTYFTFTDGSHLYFNVGNKYYEHDDIMIVHTADHFWIMYIIA